MSEYWVSQAKFYCKFCNVWIADNKPTRQLHDGGAKHRFNVDDFHKKKRNEKLFGARSEGEIKQQLAEIERAAKEAVAADRLEATGLFYQHQKPTALGPGLPPPPPSRPSSADSSDEARSSSYGRRDRDAPDEEEEKLDVIEEDESGMYVVDGQMYLEGPRHENLLTRGMNCEVFIEDTDQWYSAVVLGRRDVAVPHTSIVLRTFEISYVKIEGQDAEEEQEEEEEDEEMPNDKFPGDGIDAVIPSNVEEPISSIQGAFSSPPEMEIMPPPPVEGPPPPPPPPQFKTPPPIFKLPLKPVINEIEKEDENENKNKDKNKNEDEVVAVKRVRRSRWDTVTPLLEGSAVSEQTVCPPPPPPPLPPMLGALIRSVAMEGITEELTHSESSRKVGQTVIEAAEGSDLQRLEETQEPDMQTIVISGVRSDHLRLLCNEAGELQGPSGDVVSTRASRAGIIIPEVVESTGFGKWQTVSIRTIDEEEEALLREEESRKEIEDARQATGGGIQSRAHLPEEDVMSTFDPYGTSIYKGRRVNQDQGNDEVVTMAKKGEVVGFKKRKKSGIVANTVTDGRHNDADLSLNASSSGSSSGRSSTHIEATNSVSMPQNVHIKTENLEDTETASKQRDLDEVIKTEIKQEPSIESGTSGVKTSFSFNGSRKQRKSYQL